MKKFLLLSLGSLFFYTTISVGVMKYEAEFESTQPRLAPRMVAEFEPPQPRLATPSQLIVG